MLEGGAPLVDSDELLERDAPRLTDGEDALARDEACPALERVRPCLEHDVGHLLLTD